MVRCGLAILGLALLVSAGCGPGAPAQTAPGAAQRSGGLKRITMAFNRELDLAHHLGQGRTILRPLVNPGLSVLDDQGVRRPVLADTIPTLENGLWKAFPDGRMETTYRIREGARWHDGVPFTTDDLLFTALVGRDREVAILNSPAFRSVDDLTALDERTIMVSWKEPYIYADALFAAATTLPLPRHRLEPQYLDSKADFPRLTFWLYDYVGTGPFRVQAWDPSRLAVLEANPDYVLGRPKLDEIEVRFIPDGNTLTASILSGGIDMAIGLGSVDRAIAIRDGWRDGRVVFQFDQGIWTALFPQLLDPRPAIIADLRFRRALLHGIDRQAIVDTLQGGVAPVAHSYLSPGQSEYTEIEARLPRYEYDPQRAMQMIEALGYTRGGDPSTSSGQAPSAGSGQAFRDPTGQRLEVEIRSDGPDAAANAAAAVADYWQRIGVRASTLHATGRLGQDPELVATFPGFRLTSAPHDLAVQRLHSAQVPLPKNGFQVSGPENLSRYMNAELDGLIDTHERTIRPQERVPLMGRIVQHVADQLPVMGIYYTANANAHGNRLLNVGTAQQGQGPRTRNAAWNAHEWDVRS